MPLIETFVLLPPSAAVTLAAALARQTPPAAAPAAQAAAAELARRCHALKASGLHQDCQNFALTVNRLISMRDIHRKPASPDLVRGIFIIPTPGIQEKTKKASEG